MMVVEITNTSPVEALLLVQKLKESNKTFEWALHHDLENGFHLRSMRISFASDEDAVLFLIRYGDIARIVEKELT